MAPPLCGGDEDVLSVALGASPLNPDDARLTLQILFRLIAGRFASEAIDEKSGARPKLASSSSPSPSFNLRQRHRRPTVARNALWRRDSLSVLGLSDDRFWHVSSVTL
jgi:hypothetical protein